MKKKRNVLRCFGLVTVATFEIDICLNKRQCHSVILFSVLHIYTVIKESRGMRENIMESALQRLCFSAICRELVTV